MWQSNPTDWTISSVNSGHLRSVFCGQPTSVLTVITRRGEFHVIVQGEFQVIVDRRS